MTRATRMPIGASGTWIRFDRMDCRGGSLWRESVGSIESMCAYMFVHGCVLLSPGVVFVFSDAFLVVSVTSVTAGNGRGYRLGNTVSARSI